MSAPNATGVAALALSAHAMTPDQLLGPLAGDRPHRHGERNGPNDPRDKGMDFFGTACSTGWCHLDFYPGGAGNPIKFSDAYGAGIVNAAAAVS